MSHVARPLFPLVCVWAEKNPAAAWLHETKEGTMSRERCVRACVCVCLERGPAKTC